MSGAGLPAVTAACEWEVRLLSVTVRETLVHGQEQEPVYAVVNRSLPRIDAYEKVTGKLKYGADLRFHGMLYARCVYSRFPHARILAIHKEKALAVPGVKCILTAQDLPGEKTMGEVIQDQYVLATDRVRYMGDVVAVVVAETPEAARAGAKAVTVDYEELPAVFTPEEALQPGAPVLHEQYPDNVCARHHVNKGDIEAGFREAEVVVERTYRTPFIEHAYVEPEAVVAIPDPTGRGVTVVGSIQNPYAVRRTLVRCLNLPMSRARVVQEAIGGTFGGKLEIMEAMSTRVALAALVTGRPVRLVNSREESLVESHKRHPYTMKYRLGFKKDGTLVALQADIVAEAGCYACMSPFVTWRSVVQGAGPYRIPNVRIDIKAVYTNNTYTGSMRGFGAPQVAFGVESAMNEAAEVLGIDPLELRLKNCLRDGDYSATGHKLDRHRVSVGEALEKVAEISDYRRRRAEYARTQVGERRRGIGLACDIRGVSLGAEGADFGSGIVSVEEDGSVTVTTGLSEHGQGLRTAFCQIAAEELGVPLSTVRYLDTDTARAPDSGPTVASRGTIMGGNAVKDAAHRLGLTMRQVAAEELGATPEDIVAHDGYMWVRGDPDRRLTFLQVVKACRSRGLILSLVGTYNAPKVHWDEEKGCGDAYFTYVYAAQVAEVEVDTVTGEVLVTGIWAAHDVGRAINPAEVAGQIAGGAAQALGFALMEEVELQQGRTRNRNLDEYVIPTALDMPEPKTIILENPDPDGPFGAKSIGECSAEVTAPAIADAIWQATGRRIRELPADLERVLLGKSLRTNRGQRGSAAAPSGGGPVSDGARSGQPGGDGK